jgi:hypothetical protein
MYKWHVFTDEEYKGDFRNKYTAIEWCKRFYPFSGVKCNNNGDYEYMSEDSQGNIIFSGCYICDTERAAVAYGSLENLKNDHDTWHQRYRNSIQHKHGRS